MITKQTVGEILAGHKGTLNGGLVASIEKGNEQSGFKNIQAYKATIEIEAATDEMNRILADIAKHEKWLLKYEETLSAEEHAEELETLNASHEAYKAQAKRKANAEKALQAANEMPEQFGLVRNHI